MRFEKKDGRRPENLTTRFVPMGLRHDPGFLRHPCRQRVIEIIGVLL